MFYNVVDETSHVSFAEHAWGKSVIMADISPGSAEALIVEGRPF
jgi:hypothetical protein